MRPGERVTVPEVRLVTKADVRPLATVLARAFQDDPVAAYIFPDAAKRPRGLARFFRLQLGGTFLRNGEAYTTTERQGGAFWLPPASPRPGMRELLEQLPMLPLLGRRLMPTLRLIGVMQSHHPRSSHYYLGTLGTDPPVQGHGIGSAMMAPVLARCDQHGIPAYLESSNIDNVPFYRRQGFEVTKELQVPDGPMLWLMWRDPNPDR
jgi:ribosomal protein S18 acetylase RimI-like enzyme